MLPSSPHVKQVYSDSIIPTLGKLASQDITQTLCIDSTTLDVDVARAVASEINTIGAQMVDAPVSGGKSFSFLAAHAIDLVNIYSFQASLGLKLARFPSW